MKKTMGQKSKVKNPYKRCFFFPGEDNKWKHFHHYYRLTECGVFIKVT